MLVTRFCDPMTLMYELDSSYSEDVPSYEHEVSGSTVLDD